MKGALRTPGEVPIPAWDDHGRSGEHGAIDIVGGTLETMNIYAHKKLLIFF